MTAVAPSKRDYVPPLKREEPPKFYSTGMASDEMCCFTADFVKIVQPFVDDWSAEAGYVWSNTGEVGGGVTVLCERWAASSGKTEEACYRAWYRIRNETTCMTLALADEILLACGEFIEDYDLVEFCGGKKAAREQAELYAEDRSELGLARYAEQKWAETVELVQAELIRRWEETHVA